MAKHYSLALGFRRRLSVELDGNGAAFLPLDKETLKLVGGEVGDEFIVTVTPEGALVLRRVGR